jgi:hypothetical protein
MDYLSLVLAPVRICWTVPLINVREHEGWVRNIALIKCTLGPGKPKRGWDSGGEGTGGQMGNKGS